MKKDRKKNGFTLVELIVVLVILAILAALLIPALVGYIDKAKQKSVIAETRSIVMAVQTEASELYASANFDEQKKLLSEFTIASKDGKSMYSTGTENKEIIGNFKERYEEIKNLSEISSLDDKGYFSAIIDADGKVYAIIYNDGKGNIGLYFGKTKEYMVMKYSGNDPCEAYANYKNKVAVFDMSKTGSIWTNVWTKESIITTLKYGGAEE